ncbi:pectin acetylesterase-family hydrolase [Corallococcus terminator]|uniref:Pectinacetylesterase n=1 Tax=Corallococcus terminator TaxID=2316733 RepID=A0A3A8J9W9_9BACT|nr:pectin acetylesterase-family hydrolase [Corallococcus terminator]RKG92502.1 hypothetical protein D7V88_05895 [Corallococcus terminator]
MRMDVFVVAFGLVVGCGRDVSWDTEPPEAVGVVASAAVATCGNGIVEQDELCDGGGAVACTGLSALYTGGQTVCASTCRGYEVARDCRVRPGVLVETIRPALRDASRWAGAKCNDGTSFAFNFSPSPTGSKVWVINLGGGGYCDGTTSACANRGVLLTSKGEPADRALETRAGSGILSRDPEENPTFADANQVSAHYCSSDLWTGTNPTPQPVDGGLRLRFNGRLNVRALLEVLRRDYGLDDRNNALKVVWTGSSAGGNGAQNNADQLARALPRAQAARRLWVISSAGWMPLNWTNPDYTQSGMGMPDPVVSAQLATLYQAEFSPECRALARAAGRQESDCFAGLPTVASLHLPVARGGLGLRTLAATNRRDPVYTTHHGLTDLSAKTNAALQEWDDLMAREMRDSGVRWLFAPSDDPRVGSQLHGVYGSWRLPFKPFNAANDVCDDLPAYTVPDFREMVTRFFEDPSPDTSRLKVCFNGEWLP